MMEKLGKEEKDRRERGDTHRGFLRRLLLLGRNTNVPVSRGAGPQGSTTAHDVLPGQPGGVAWGQPWTLPCAEEQGHTWTFRLDASASGNAGQHPYAREADTWDGAEGTGERGGASWCCWYPRPMFSGSVQRKRPPDLVPALTQPPTPPKSLPACPGSAPRGVRGRPAPSAGTAGGDVLPAASPSCGAPEPPPRLEVGSCPPQPSPSRGNQGKRVLLGAALPDSAWVVLFCLFVFFSPAPPFYKCLSL